MESCKAMNSKGSRYIVLPVYIVNIGLLYALLLTSGLLLAWITIYRHEECINELKQMLNEKDVEEQKQFSTARGARGDLGKPNEDITNDEQKKFVVNKLNQRPRRHLGSESSPGAKNIDTHQHFKGEKGEKGSGGRRGRRGKKGVQGVNGLQGTGEKGERGEDGRDGRDGRKGNSGPRGDKGDIGAEGPRGFNGTPGPQGLKGMPGPQGVKGSTGTDGAIGVGEKGDKGRKGDMGTIGIKGDKGNDGIPGMKGDQGREGKSIMYSESAHIVGSGGKILSTPGTATINPTVAWKRQHSSGSMEYKGGYLTVGIEGCYFIYSQMYYYDGNASIMGHTMYIDDKKVLVATYSVVNTNRKYQTQFTSGIFNIRKGQKISVRTPFTKYYYFKNTDSFFGAFLLHP